MKIEEGLGTYHIMTPPMGSLSWGYSIITESVDTIDKNWRRAWTNASFILPSSYVHVHVGIHKFPESGAHKVCSKLMYVIWRWSVYSFFNLVVVVVALSTVVGTVDLPYWSIQGASLATIVTSLVPWMKMVYVVGLCEFPKMPNLLVVESKLRPPCCIFCDWNWFLTYSLCLGTHDLVMHSSKRFTVGDQFWQLCVHV